MAQPAQGGTRGGILGEPGLPSGVAAIELPVKYLVGIVIGALIVVIAVMLLAMSQGLGGPIIQQINEVFGGLFG